MICSSCKQSGHNKTTCPNKKSSATTKIETAQPIPKFSIVDMDTTKFLEFVSKIEDTNIVLLRQKEVIQWLFGDLSFLPTIEKKNKTNDVAKYKVLEDKWGQATLKIRRPDLKLWKSAWSKV